MLKLVLPITLIFVFDGEAADLAFPSQMRNQVNSCQMSPTGLINPHYTMHKIGFEGIRCWHSGYRTLITFPKKFIPIPQPKPLLNSDQLYQQYLDWLQRQQFICLTKSKDCILHY